MTEESTQARLVESLDGTLVARVAGGAMCGYALACAESVTHVIAFPPLGENGVLGVCKEHAELHERLSAPRT